MTVIHDICQDCPYSRQRCPDCYQPTCVWTEGERYGARPDDCPKVTGVYK
ncbi:hypothetical protein [Candidatus Magnetobacterium casense]|nr:hypothetical protein [Candidatus Magnetobacterium casensis]